MSAMSARSLAEMPAGAAAIDQNTQAQMPVDTAVFTDGVERRRRGERSEDGKKKQRLRDERRSRAKLAGNLEKITLHDLDAQQDVHSNLTDAMPDVIPIRFQCTEFVGTPRVFENRGVQTECNNLSTHQSTLTQDALQQHEDEDSKAAIQRQLERMEQQMTSMQDQIFQLTAQINFLVSRSTPPGLSLPEEPPILSAEFAEASNENAEDELLEVCYEADAHDTVDGASSEKLARVDESMTQQDLDTGCNMADAAIPLPVMSSCWTKNSQHSLTMRDVGSLVHVMADQMQDAQSRKLQDTQKRDSNEKRQFDLHSLQHKLECERQRQLARSCLDSPSFSIQQRWDQLRQSHSLTHTVHEALVSVRERLHPFLKSLDQIGDILDANAMQIYLRHCCVKSATYEAEEACFNAAATGLDMMARHGMHFTVKIVTDILLQVSLRSDWNNVRSFAIELFKKTLTHLPSSCRSFLCDHALFALAERKAAYDKAMTRLTPECAPEMRFCIDWEQSKGQEFMLHCKVVNKERDELAKKGFVALLSAVSTPSDYSRHEEGALVQVKLNDKGFVARLLTQVRISFYGYNAEYRLDVIETDELQAERIMSALQILGGDNSCKDLRPHRELQKPLVTPGFKEYSISLILKPRVNGKCTFRLDNEFVDGGEFGRLDNSVDPIRVRNIGSGPLSAHPAGVAIGDYVVEVNGERDREAMIQEIRESQSLSNCQVDLTMARPIMLEDLDLKLPEAESVHVDEQDLANLNESQKKAITHSLTHRLSLIQGPPGTGKTKTAIELLDILIRHNRSGAPILATAETNAAVDNLVRGVAKKGRVVARSGDPSKVAEDCQQYLKRTVKEWRGVDVICTTCIGSGSNEFKKQGAFDTVLIDECSQATEALSLIPICHAAKRVILVGDQCQLEPFRSEISKKFGLGMSLFNRLCQQGVMPVMLNQQYRMHPGISEFPAAAFYGSKLGNGISAGDRPLTKAWRWPSEDMPVCFVDAVHGQETDGDTEKSNPHEVQLVLESVSRLLKDHELLPQSIGVVTPYAAQKAAIEEQLNDDRRGCFNGVEVNTVDAFQGREKEIIVFSAVRSEKTKSIGFVGDWRRINVMLTRARRGLILIGNRKALNRQSWYWQDWLQWAAARGCIMLAENGRMPESYLRSSGSWAGRCLVNSWMPSSSQQRNTLEDEQELPRPRGDVDGDYIAESAHYANEYFQKPQHRSNDRTLYDNVRTGGKRQTKEQEIVYKTQDSEQYAKVVSLLGGKPMRCCVILCDGFSFQGAEVNCKVPNKIRRVRPDDLVLVDIVEKGAASKGTRHGEIVFKYEPEEGLVERLLQTLPKDNEFAEFLGTDDADAEICDMEKSHTDETGSYMDMMDLPDLDGSDLGDSDTSTERYDEDSPSGSTLDQWLSVVQRLLRASRSKRRVTPATTDRPSLPLYTDDASVFLHSQQSAGLDLDDVAYDGATSASCTVVVHFDRIDGDGVMGSLPEWGSNFEAYLPAAKSARGTKKQLNFLNALRRGQITTFAADVLTCESRRGRFYFTLTRESMRDEAEQDALENLRKVEGVASMVDKAATDCGVDLLQARRAILYKPFEEAGGLDEVMKCGAKSGPTDPRLAAVDLLRRCGNPSEHESRTMLLHCIAGEDLPSELPPLYTSVLDLCEKWRSASLVTLECRLRFLSPPLTGKAPGHTVNVTSWEEGKRTYHIARPCRISSCLAMQAAGNTLGKWIPEFDVNVTVAGPGVCKFSIQCADEESEDIQDQLDDAIDQFEEYLDALEGHDQPPAIVRSGKAEQHMQPTITIGVIGDVAHGKSTTIKKLTNKSTQQHSSEQQAHGITIRLGYANCLVCRCPECPESQCYFTAECKDPFAQNVPCKRCTTAKASIVKRVSFVDCPGHAELMGTMLSGLVTFDAVLFVAAADAECPAPQAKAHIEALRATACDMSGKVAIIQSKTDLVVSRHKSDAVDILRSHRAAAIAALHGIAEDAPVFPVAAPHDLGLAAVASWLASLPDRPSASPSTDACMPILRQFDTNKPGTDACQIAGLVFGGSLSRGEICVGGDVELRPGRFERYNDGSFTVRPVSTQVRAIQSGDGEGTISLERAAPGGLVALQTTLCPSFFEDSCFDASVIGSPGTLPPAWQEIELEHTYITDSIDLMNEEAHLLQLRVHAGSAHAEAAVVHVNQTTLVVRLLDKPLCMHRGSTLLIEKKGGKHWILCARCKLVGGVQCHPGKDDEPANAAALAVKASALPCHDLSEHFVQSFLWRVTVGNESSKAPIPEIKTEDLHREGKASILWKNFVSVMEGFGRKPGLFVNFLKSETALESALAGDDRRMLRVAFRGFGLRDRLQSVLEKFVDIYVKCRQCGSHDTHLESKSSRAKLECRCCKALCFAEVVTEELNILASDAPGCRYKMPALQVQVRGTGKMIRTVILNIDDVAEALSRSEKGNGSERVCFISTPENILRFFSHALGTDADADTNSVGGSWGASKLQDILRQYIDDFVCCPECTLPELNFHFAADGVISGLCRACPWEDRLDPARSHSQRLIEHLCKKSGLR